MSSKEKYEVIKAVAESLNRHSYPPMDVGLKSILASQIGYLLRGGFLLDDIQRMAVELGLAYDDRRGHNRLLHLASRVRSQFWAQDRQAHDERKSEWSSIDPVVAASLPTRSRPHPNLHPFSGSDADRSSCRLCGGPVGVHVRA